MDQDQSSATLSAYDVSGPLAPFVSTDASLTVGSSQLSPLRGQALSPFDISGPFSGFFQDPQPDAAVLPPAQPFAVRDYTAHSSSMHMESTFHAQDPMAGMPPPLSHPWTGVVKGQIHAPALSVDFSTQVFAELLEEPGCPMITDTSGWPQVLNCDVTSMRVTAATNAALSDPAVQRYARLVPHPAALGGNESADVDQLAQLARLMAEWNMSFQIPCEFGALQLVGSASPATIYVIFLPGYHALHWMLFQNVLLQHSTPVWTGFMHLRGYQQSARMRAGAIPINVHNRPRISDTSAWPAQLDCFEQKMARTDEVYKLINDTRTQWYFRIVVLDRAGRETSDRKLPGILRAIIARRVVYRLPCGGGGESPVRGTPGHLFIWGFDLQPHGHSLLGVFRPHGTS